MKTDTMRKELAAVRADAISEILHDDWIYISGPITGVKDYMDHFSEAEVRLTDQGWRVVNPAKMGWILPKDATWDDFMRIDFMLLKGCGTICMLKDWEKSAGAKAEMAFALENGIRVIYHEIEKKKDHGPDVFMYRS